MNVSGILIGLGSFLIIGTLHPVVIKVEYHIGKRAQLIGKETDRAPPERQGLRDNLDASGFHIPDQTCPNFNVLDGLAVSGGSGGKKDVVKWLSSTFHSKRRGARRAI